MLSYDNALRHVLGSREPLRGQQTLLEQALGLVCAADIVAPFPFPPFTNSAMDGFAVRGSDIRQATNVRPIVLPISGIAVAGSQPSILRASSAVHIMTGAPLPEGADAVVPIEDVTVTGTDVEFRTPAADGENVRHRGTDQAPGDVVIQAGDVICPAHVGVAAMCGQESILTIPRPTVAIMSTGDELVTPGQTLRPGCVYNSNLYAIRAQVIEADGIPTVCIHAGDTIEEISQGLELCKGADIVITIGGVSMGERDLVRKAVEARGTLDFWKVAIRPGKPLAFGSVHNSAFFGLPGNPVSAMVTFELFVRPLIRKLGNHRTIHRERKGANLVEDLTHAPGRRSFQRVNISQAGNILHARPVFSQSSSALRSMVLANALVEIPEDSTGIKRGEIVSAIMIGPVAI